ncbi:hypothetical protein QEH59_18100 [Coraliomargarita sp. SDUM461004]|uniref:Uncharacterized protein n=1 Tax=Thalassobacterium sedimentorum TaxID=3041258 RepID=A0ABU1ANH6_9BACT|nr:hypothetical protein [Coraliomargarita sp. SDUM461004]MDQ8196348.1 hypothetical protein [Coraliomargarita sp. SDUM461004]
MNKKTCHRDCSLQIPLLALVIVSSLKRLFIIHSSNEKKLIIKNKIKKSLTGDMRNAFSAARFDRKVLARFFLWGGPQGFA